MRRLAELALDRPIATSALLLAATAVLAVFAARVGSQTGYRAYLGDEHPAVVRLDGFVERFGGGLPISTAWSCAETGACEDVFDPRAVRMASRVVERMRAAEGVRRVESAATTSLLVSRGDALEGVTAETERGRPLVRERATRNPLWRGQLVSGDGQTGAIVVQLASSESAATKRVLGELQAALAPHEEDGFRFHITGQTAQLALTDESLARDTARLTPLMIALVAAVIALLFRSWQAVAGAIATVGAAALWTTGLMGLLGWPQNAILQTIPPLVLVIALCDGIHLLSRYAHHRAAVGAVARADRRGALLRAAEETGPPCLATTLTTAAGFLSFTLSGLESFVRFGVLAAAGVSVALLLTFSLLPLVMLGLPAERTRAARSTERWGEVLTRLTAATRRRARPILLATLALCGVCALGVAKLRVDVDEYELYGEGSSVVQAFRFLEAELRPPDTLELAVSLPAEAELHDPAVLERLRALETELASVPELGRVHSLLDAMRWTNRLLHDEDPREARLGATRAENASLLSMLSFEGPALLDPWTSPDFRELRFSVEAKKLPQSERGAVLARVREALDRHLPEAWRTELTGSFAVYFELVREIHETQLASFGTAAGVVFLLLAGFLWRRPFGPAAALGWAAVGMFPTLVPVVGTLGAMGWAGVALDMGTAMVAAVVIGIAVDDTIHLLSAFAERRRAGEDAAAAVSGAVLHVGKAVATTSLALSVGFLVMLVSSWQSIASFGLLAGVAIFGACVADLVVLPATVYALAARRAAAPARGGAAEGAR